jgi:hypothetical protein
LTDEHPALINNINYSYDQWALRCNPEPTRYDSLDKASFVHFLNDEQEMFKSLIEFFKLIPEFQQFSLNERILLIKCNLSHLIHIHHVLKSQFVENTDLSHLFSCWTSPSFYSRISGARHRYAYFCEHPIILKLTLVTMIFTINLSRLPEGNLSYDFSDRKSLVNCQETYLILLWNYLNFIFDERVAVQSMSLVVFQYLRYQRLLAEMDGFIREHFRPDQFHPLTKSVFRLT